MGDTTLDCPGLGIIDLPGVGTQVPFQGAVRGNIDGVWDDTDIVHVLQATSPGGSRIELAHMGQLDLVNEPLDLDVTQGVFLAGGNDGNN